MLEISRRNSKKGMGIIEFVLGRGGISGGVRKESGYADTNEEKRKLKKGTWELRVEL